MAKNSKTDPKSVYAYISSQTKPREIIPDLSKPDGSLTKTDYDKSEVLNTIFSSVFMVEDTANIHTFDTRSSSIISLIEVNDKQIHDKLSTLNVSKSPGPDGMHPIILKGIE